MRVDQSSLHCFIEGEFYQDLYMYGRMYVL